MASDGEVRIDITGNADSLEKSIKQATESIKRETKKWGDATSKAGGDMTASASKASDKIQSEARQTGNAIKNEAQKSADAGQSSASKFEQSFTSALKQIGAAFTAAAIGKKILEFGKDAINAASDLEEVQNVVDVTFGEATSTIDAWAKNAITQFGLTETQAKRFASTMGAMLKSSGAASDDIVEMSTTLAGLAADMASFYNLDFDTAFQKIRSGIAGETEPLKQLGINMSVANLEAYALTQGITKAFDKMSQGEQIMLRYQYMMQATADAQGDFARTSDGYANSIRQFQSELDSIKTKIGEKLLPPLTGVIVSLNRILELMDSHMPTTLMDEFNQIQFEKDQKIAQIQAVYDEATSLKNLLDEIALDLTFTRPKGEGEEETTEEANKLFAEEVAELLALGNQSEEAAEKLAALGFSSEDIADAQYHWLDVCKRLVQTIPSLSSVIDTNTGEIKDGIGPLTEWLEKWREFQIAEAEVEAVLQQRQAIAEDTTVRDRKMELYYAQAELERLEKQLAARGKTPSDALANWRNTPGILASSETKETYALYRQYAEAYQNVQIAEENLTAAEQARTEALERQAIVEEEAQDKLAATKDALGEVEKEMTLMELAAQGDADALAQVTTALDEAHNALVAVDEYQSQVRENVARSVSSVIKGFDKIETPMDKINKKILDIQNNKDLSLIEKNKQIMQISLDLPTAGKMTAGLEDQTEYMREYMRLIKELEGTVLDPELLAQLSDGSTESFDYLSRLANADEEELLALNDAYAEHKQVLEDFEDTLTNKQLEVDDAYQNLVDIAQAAVDALDMEQGAYDSVSATVNGITTALADKKAAVATQVDGILAELARLENQSYGVSVLAPSFVGTFRGSGKTVDGINANGLDYVPFDGYLSQLHEGESVLTAEEARIWRQFKEGGTSSRNNIDYNALSGAIWSSAPSMGGGNVYLDGQTVGRVISARQADSYRALQRSGWSA